MSSIREMIAAGLLCFGLTHSCRLMKQGEYKGEWRKRLRAAPKNYLAVDFIKLGHEGESIEGVDRQYTHNGITWGHCFTTSSLVFTDGQDPYRLRADAAPSKGMASEHFPYLTPSEAMLNVVGDVLVAGYALKGVLVDADPANLRCVRCLIFLQASSDALEPAPTFVTKLKRSKLKNWLLSSDLDEPVTTDS